MRVVFTDEAQADLEAIGDWIDAENPSRAVSFLIELRERCVSLADRPRRFPIARRSRGLIFRKLTYRDYLIFYQVLPDRVEIEHVVHGARDWARLLDRP